MSVQVIVQYQVIVSQAYDAYYKLTDPHLQIKSYVEDIVRSTVPKMELDSAFEAKEELAEAIKESLQHTMTGYGYNIIQSLVRTSQSWAGMLSSLAGVSGQSTHPLSTPTPPPPHTRWWTSAWTKK